MLPDTLHLLDRADRRGYASILAHMASSDGDISVEELATFEGRMGNALIAPMSRKDLRLELKRPKPISLAAREMSDESLLLALRDALLLAAADGVFEPREKEIIAMIAKEAGVSESELDRARANFLATESFERESVSGMASKLGHFHVLGGDFRQTPPVIKHADATQLRGIAGLRAAGLEALLEDLVARERERRRFEDALVPAPVETLGGLPPAGALLGRD